MTLQEFVDKWNGKKADLFASVFRTGKGFMSNLKRRIIFMNKCVFNSCGNFKIFNSIVGSITVFMMNNIRAFKFYTKSCFNYLYEKAF